ncbi:MAG: choice-of-anchor X domain-containing protein [bacterium]
MADDLYSCDDNPGGPHFIGALVDDPELAWGEGYPDYWQSLVRDQSGASNASRYLDIGAGGTGGINVDLEATQPADLVSVLYEFAIAGALWDLYDTAPDGQDTLGYGPNGIQRVYTGDTFQSVANGFFDDDCDFDTFARAWVQDGQPANAVTAAIIAQNTGYTLSPDSSAPITAGADGANAPQAVSNTPQGPTDGAWWNQVTYVLDNSQSMAGAKFDAAKTVLLEAINDLGQQPEGTELRLETFNHDSTSNDPVFAGQFFPERLTSTVEGLSPSSATDGNCQVSALRALAQAIEGQERGHVWLFTDGDTYQTPSVGNVTHMLNERGIRASMALMGDCAGSLNALSPEQQTQLQGAAKQTLGPAAEEVPGGVVPYLLTAVNSGGQFLFVDDSQVDNAADILRAQITHSAGAGAWSDYVSDFPTYRWDELPSWEYEWIDATGGTDHGAPSGGSLDISPMPLFSYYGESYNSVRAYKDGYLVFDANTYGDAVANNVPIPNDDLPSNALYPFWDELTTQYVCAQDHEPPGCGTVAEIFSLQQEDWFAIQYDNFFSGEGFLTFQTLLNLESGEIRYQYSSLPDDAAGSATIGIEDKVADRGVQISHNDNSGATGGMGYKLLPAPPQPSKTYEVAVDGAMDGVGFLLTGYSGSFEPLEVRTPGGALVDCNDTDNVLCLDLGLVQYVQADVDGRVGDWEATVEAGSSGEGTFSFTSIAASALSVEGRGDHGLTTASNSGLLVDLGQPADGDTLSGQFVTPTDETFGGSFTLYDDGNHGDGVAGDGLFGSDSFTPPGAGAAYLRVTGQKDGQPFSRIDPVPYRFQPLRLESLGDGYNDGGTTQMYFELENLDEHDHCYWIDSDAPEDWTVLGFGTQFCVDAGETIVLTAYVDMGSANNTLPSGTSGELTLTATEMEEGQISASGSATLTRTREPEHIEIHNPTDYLRPGGDTAELGFMVTDSQGKPVADGTEVELRPTLGDISPTVAKTSGGYFTATFTSGGDTGDAVVTADYGAGLVMADTVIPIREPFASNIELTAGAQTLPTHSGSTALEALVTDRWGDPVSGAPLRIGVEGDEQLGSVDGQVVVTGQTDANGRFSATFESGELPGQAGVRAELLVPEGNDYRSVHDDRKEITIGAKLYLPAIRSGP